MKKRISIILAILMCFSCFSIISFAQETDSEHITTVPEGYVGIYTKDDLDNIKLNLSGKYILMNDIVFTEEDYAEGGSFYNSGKGWSPIGTKDYPFTGIFDGNTYKIHNLTVNNPNKAFQGFFGYIQQATIKNVTLVNVNIVGLSSVGGICGFGEIVDDAITNCKVHGNIRGTSEYVGGIIGYVDKPYAGGSLKRISNCINLASVSGKSYVGGICGRIETKSYISFCINNGNIEATGDAKTCGGIVGSSGELATRIENSYNTGNIYGTNSGGIIGSSCTVVNSYSIGTAEKGNIAGFKSADSYITYCYYLDSLEYSTTYTNGIGKSKDQMIKQTTYEGWDFNTVWTMDGREDYPYPELRDVPLIFPDELNHEHEYSSEITTPATHLTEGVMTYTCSCGDTYTEAIEKTTEHTYNAVVTEPTCTDRGFTLYFCACNDFYKQEIPLKMLWGSM